MFAFFSVTENGLQTLNSNTSSLEGLQTNLVILFVLAILVGLCSLLYYFFIKNSPDLSLRFLFPTLQSKKKNVFIEIEDDLGRPLNFAKCSIFKGEKLIREFYSKSPNLSLSLKNSDHYQITLNKFGYQPSLTDSFSVDKEKLKFNLTLRRSEDVKESSFAVKFSTLNLTLSFSLAILSLTQLLLAYLNLNLSLQLTLIALFGFSLYLSYRFFLVIRSIRTYSFKNRPLRNERIKIFSKDHQLLKSTKTSPQGALRLFFAPGTYRFVPEKHSPRIVKIFDQGIGNFKVKF